MAKMVCRCGNSLRDDNSDYSYFMLSWREFDVDVDPAVLMGRATQAWGCQQCGRLWVFWENLGKATEYIPQAGYGI